MSDKKKTNKLIDNLVYDLTDIYKLYAERTEDPVIVAGVFFAVAMAKMRRELDDKEFEIFIEQFDDVKEIIMEEEKMYSIMQTKIDEGDFDEYLDDDDEKPTIH